MTETRMCANERGDFGDSAWRYNCGNCKESRTLGPPHEMRRCMVWAIGVVRYDSACPSWEPRKRARKAGAEQGVLW